MPVNPELSILSSIRQKLNRDSKANLWVQIVRTLDDADECFYHPVHCRLVVSCVVTCQFTMVLENVNQTQCAVLFFLLLFATRARYRRLSVRSKGYVDTVTEGGFVHLAKFEQSGDFSPPGFLWSFSSTEIVVSIPKTKGKLCAM